MSPRTSVPTILISYLVATGVGLFYVGHRDVFVAIFGTFAVVVAANVMFWIVFLSARLLRAISGVVR